MFESILNPIFSPLLSLGYFWAIIILAFVLTLLITLVYKYTTNQGLMKKLKGDMKTLQNQAKELNKTNPSKAMSLQKKIMEKNMTYMKHSLKPTLFTFIPIIIIFGWLSANLAYEPIAPNQPFDVSVLFQEGSFGNISISAVPDLQILSNVTQTVDSSSVSWTLSGDPGDYQLVFMFGNREYTKDILISDIGYVTPETPVKDSEITKIIIHNKEVKPLGSLSIFGWEPGWLGTYIIFSLLFSLGLRKLMKLS